jgi:hypothetical protein
MERQYEHRSHIPDTKDKGKVVLVLNLAQRREDVLGSGGIAPRILDLGTRLS